MGVKFITCVSCGKVYNCFNHGDFTFCDDCDLNDSCEKIEPSSKSENVLIGSWCNECLNRPVEDMEG